MPVENEQEANLFERPLSTQERTHFTAAGSNCSSSSYAALGRARAANFVRPAKASGPISTIQGSGGQFRAPQPSRARTSGKFKRPSEAEQARSRKHRQVRCFRAAPSNETRVKLRLRIELLGELNIGCDSNREWDMRIESMNTWTQPWDYLTLRHGLEMDIQ